MIKGLSPLEVLVYYGYPSQINGSRSLEQAVEHFRPYSLAIIGDGLQNRDHPDHDKTRELLPSLPNTRFFGYVDLGLSTQNLTRKEIAERVDDWAALGVRGVLLDDYGHDFGVTRDRQIQAVELVHKAGMNAIANAWEPRDALDDQPSPGNPKGAPTPLLGSDYFLCESFQIKNGQPVSLQQWRGRADTLRRLSQRTGVPVIGVATGGQFHEHHLAYAWFSAVLDSHAGFAWGEPNFSADSSAPYRARPYPELGSRFLGPPRVMDGEASRVTDRGQIRVAPRSVAASFVPGVTLVQRLLGIFGRA